MAQAVGELREVAFEIGEIEHRCSRPQLLRPYQRGGTTVLPRICSQLF
jgi:hypothetical protein